MYNLPPLYSTPNNYYKSSKLYNKQFSNLNKITNINKLDDKKNYNSTHKQEIFKNNLKLETKTKSKSYEKSNIKIQSDELSRNKSNTNNDILFEIFGLKIYFDDVLIICILLFLYQEGIKDEYLFITLILLLLN